MLGRIIERMPSTVSFAYVVLDVDDEQAYTLPESQIFQLGQLDNQKRISKGDEVYALYPDTTSFYPALVLHGAKKSMQPSEASVVVQFIGDEDTSGLFLSNKYYQG